MAISNTQHTFSTLTVRHEGLAFPLIVPAAALLPHVGVVRLGVLVLHPSRSSRDGDNVENNGEEQEQGHDPPASGVRDTTAKHDRRTGVEKTERTSRVCTELRVFTQRCGVSPCVQRSVSPSRYMNTAPPDRRNTKPVGGPAGLGSSAGRVALTYSPRAESEAQPIHCLKFHCGPFGIRAVFESMSGGSMEVIEQQVGGEVG